MKHTTRRGPMLRGPTWTTRARQLSPTKDIDAALIRAEAIV